MEGKFSTFHLATNRGKHEKPSLVYTLKLDKLLDEIK
jgi:hypothetical protein